MDFSEGVWFVLGTKMGLVRVIGWAYTLDVCGVYVKCINMLTRGREERCLREVLFLFPLMNLTALCAFGFRELEVRELGGHWSGLSVRVFTGCSTPSDAL